MAHLSWPKLALAGSIGLGGLSGLARMGPALSSPTPGAPATALPAAGHSGTRAPSARAEATARVIDLPEVLVAPRLHPLGALSKEELRSKVQREPEALGTLSIGKPNRGMLANGVRLETDEFLRVVNPERAWGTPETLSAVRAAVATVQRSIPNTPPLFIGDLSSQRGGYIRPHRSHQSGRDVDVGYYYKGESKWYVKATAENLDVPRTWELFKAIVSEGDVEFIFMDRSIQELLLAHAEQLGEPPAWLDSLFHPAPRAQPLVRHARGHQTHFHVRFHDNLATMGPTILEARLGRGASLRALPARAAGKAK